MWVGGFCPAICFLMFRRLREAQVDAPSPAEPGCSRVQSLIEGAKVGNTRRSRGKGLPQQFTKAVVGDGYLRRHPSPTIVFDHLRLALSQRERAQQLALHK